MNYAYQPGDRVFVKPLGKYGEVTACVPGNGTIAWYFVKPDDGDEDRWTEGDLERA